MKQMKTYWIAGVCTLVAGVIAVVGIFSTVISFIVDHGIESGQQVELTPEQALELFSAIGGWYLFIIVIGIFALVFAILHLVNYSKGSFEPSSKVAHALYQFFFGLSWIGLIIVLVIQPKQPEAIQTSNPTF